MLNVEIVKDKKRHQNMALSDMNQARYPQVVKISKKSVAKGTGPSL